MKLETVAPFLLIGSLLLWAANVIWAFRDARRRGRSGVLIAALVAGTFPLGVLLWLSARPDLADEEAGERDADPDAAIKRRANAGQL